MEVGSGLPAMSVCPASSGADSGKNERQEVPR